MDLTKMTHQELWEFINDCTVAIMENDEPHMKTGEFRDCNDVYYISLRYIEEEE